MLVEVRQLKTLSPIYLDRLLAAGWFRSSSSISRLQYLCIDDAVGSVINIRAKLKNYKFGRNARKLLKQNKQKFTHTIRKIEHIDTTREQLYQQQKERFEIFIMDNLSVFLYDYSRDTDSVFNTHEVCIYDGDKLVAVSFFDLGSQSVASILGLYNADYQKYSLGNYTLFLEIEYAIENGFTCFYPGYVILSEKGYVFDYKLRLENLQFRDSHGVWKNIKYLSQERWIHHLLQEQIDRSEQSLNTAKITYQLLLYPYFAIAQFVSYYQCIKTPIFFQIGEEKDYPLILEYLISEEHYRLGYASNLDDFFFEMMTESVKLSDKFYASDKYAHRPLKYDNIILEANQLDEILIKIKELCKLA
ncbi:MAG: GNAT family N-acetyltransferase [Cytophagales bacterium]|nr:MAG: GNAT family N-acetyltransferase [Cytophagales bacterium]